MGAVTSRMMTSTSATSMIGVTLILVMASDCENAPWAMSASHHGDLGRSERLGVVDHVDERPVRHVVVAADHDEAGSALGQQRLEGDRQRLARNDHPVDPYRAVGVDRELDAIRRRLLAGL